MPVIAGVGPSVVQPPSAPASASTTARIPAFSHGFGCMRANWKHSSCRTPGAHALSRRRAPRAACRGDSGDGDCAPSMGADPQLLTEVPIFSLLDEKERATLAERVETVHFASGTVLFNRGDPGDSLYVVRSGAVELFFKNDTGERIVLDTVTRGHFFGEISLLDGGARTASAVAIKDVEAVVVDREDL